jgi:hypothetical protein
MQISFQRKKGFSSLFNYWVFFSYFLILCLIVRAILAYADLYDLLSRESLILLPSISPGTTHVADQLETLLPSISPGTTHVADQLEKERRDMYQQALNKKQESYTALPRDRTYWNLAKRNPGSQRVTINKPRISLPQFKTTPQNILTIVLIMSAGSDSHFPRRQAIRNTWKQQHPNVFFLVGQSNSSEETQFLQLEQSLYNDLVELPFVDDYSLLPEKVLQAYSWALSTFPNVQWLIKVDDDSYVRLPHLQNYLQKYNPSTPMLIGKIVEHSQVLRDGKWAEHDEYKEMYYPLWPQGATGHILSQAATRYLVNNSETLHRYQGEDVSIGIWLNQTLQEERLPHLTYIQAEKLFAFDKKLANACYSKDYLIIGHDITPDGMSYCHKASISLTMTDSIWVDSPHL